MLKRADLTSLHVVGSAKLFDPNNPEEQNVITDVVEPLQYL